MVFGEQAAKLDTSGSILVIKALTPFSWATTDGVTEIASTLSLLLADCGKRIAGNWVHQEESPWTDVPTIWVTPSGN